MDLRPTFEQEQLRQTLRRMLDQRLAVVVDELPSPPRHDPAQALRDAIAVGLLGLGLPEQVGGAGSFADLAVAHEELGRGLGAPLLTTVTLAGRLVLHTADGEDGHRLLGDLASGRLLAAPALDEGAYPGTPPATVVTRAGDGLRVDGVKRRVVNGRDVDELLVLARIDDAGTPTVVRVPGDAPGVEWSEERGATDVPHWRVTLAGATAAPAQQLRDDATAGLAAYRREQIVLAAARSVGGGRAVLDRTVDHVRTRHQFDRPIGTFQAVQHQLAAVATALDAAALAVAQAAWAVDAGCPVTEARRLTSIAGLASRQAFRDATLVAHQLHGGMGFVLDSPLHLWSARAVGDPTVPLARRHLLDELAEASGLPPA